MEINNISRVSQLYQTNGESRPQASRPNRVGKETSTTEIVQNSSRSPDYTVTLSAKGRGQSVSDFDRTQKNEKSLFTRKQNNRENMKTRELENEKKNFESKQATEEKTFEAQQRMKKQLFQQQQKRANYS